MHLRTHTHSCPQFAPALGTHPSLVMRVSKRCVWSPVPNIGDSNTPCPPEYLVPLLPSMLDFNWTVIEVEGGGMRMVGWLAVIDAPVCMVCLIWWLNPQPLLHVWSDWHKQRTPDTALSPLGLPTPISEALLSLVLRMQDIAMVIRSRELESDALMSPCTHL